MAQENVNRLEMERRTLREELNDLKQREQSLINDATELEEENINLQKQVSLFYSKQKANNLNSKNYRSPVSNLLKLNSKE